MSSESAEPESSGRIRRSSRGRRWRRFKRSLRHHPRRAAGYAGLGLLVVAMLWCAWSAFAVSRDLGAAEREAGIMRSALVRGDADGARKALGRFQDATSSAEDRTGGLTWSMFGAVPLLGDDAQGIETISSVLADLGRDGLTPVLDAADEVTADAFQPTDGRFPLEQIAALAGPAQTSEQAFARATDELSAVRPEDFVGPLRSRFEFLTQLVEDARGTLESTYRAARLMPQLLGQDGRRNYLLVLQNNAELRSGGGLPGAVSLIGTDRGAVDIVEQTDMSKLAIGREPVVKLSPEEERVFGPTLGWAPVNATLTPDLSRSAELVRAFWERKSDTKPDGVFFVDPVAVSYLMRGVGPVAVPGYPAITADTVVQSVENDIYRFSTDADVHSDYQQAVAEAVFDAFSSGVGDTAETIRGLVRGVLEGRIRMVSFLPDEEAEIAGTEIAGSFETEAGASPHVGIYLNDAGPTKLQYYLNYQAEVFARSCDDDGRQVISGSIDFRTNVPLPLPRSITGEGLSYQRNNPGSQLIFVYITSPVGGEVTELRVDDQRQVDPVVEPYTGRKLIRIGVQLEPQDERSIDFTMTSGPGQDEDVELRVTPGAFPSSSNGSAPSACVVR